MGWGWGWVRLGCSLLAAGDRRWPERQVGAVYSATWAFHKNSPVRDMRDLCDFVILVCLGVGSQGRVLTRVGVLVWVGVLCLGVLFVAAGFYIPGTVLCGCLSLEKVDTAMSVSS